MILSVFFKGLISSLSHPSSTIVSGLSITMYSPIACFTPSLFPAPYPAFSPFSINLTFGYASRGGVEYLYNKILAMVHGLTDEITPVKGNSHLLIGSLYDKIPDDQLTRYKLDVLIIRLCNMIYIWNYACLKAVRTSYQKRIETRLLQISDRLLHNPVD